MAAYLDYFFLFFRSVLREAFQALMTFFRKMLDLAAVLPACYGALSCFALYTSFILSNHIKDQKRDNDSKYTAYNKL